MDSPEFPKIGIYSLNGQGKTLGSVAEKIPRGTFSFMVTSIPADSNMQNWCADMAFHGQAPPEHEKAGLAVWKLVGHPEKRCFIIDGESLLECDEGLNRKRIWRLETDNFQGSYYKEIVGPPKKVFPSQNFKDAVLEVDPDENAMFSPSTQIVVEACAGHQGTLPSDALERQRALVALYTAETPLYHQMNAALREDNLHQMRYFASYIKELRDVFKTDHLDQIIEPFVGKIWRGISMPEEALDDYQVGTLFVWPAFTSMSTNRDVALHFGNVTFEVECFPPEGTYEDDVPEYAPASISEFSVFQGEDEILFPPNVSFRVLRIEQPNDENGLDHPLVVCTVVGFDTEDGMQSFEKLRTPSKAPARASTAPVQRHQDEKQDVHDPKQLEQLRARLEEEVSRFDMTCAGLDQRVRNAEGRVLEILNLHEESFQEKLVEKLLKKNIDRHIQDFLHRMPKEATRFHPDAESIGADSRSSPSRVSAIEEELSRTREQTRRLEEAIESRRLDARKFAKHAEDDAERMEQRIGEAMKQIAHLQVELKLSMRTCMEKQDALEQRQAASDRCQKRGLVAHAEEVRRLVERCNNMPKMLDERLGQARAASQKEMSESIRAALQVGNIAQMGQQAWQNQGLLPGCVPALAHHALH